MFQDGKSLNLTHSSHLKNVWPTKRNLIFKVSSKTAAKSLADGVVQLAILCIYIRRIVEYSATVKIVKTATVKTILSAFHLRGFLLPPSSLFALNVKPPLRFAWKPKNAPRRDVRRNDVNWSLVATSLLGNCGYQRNLWTKQNCTPLAILARQNCKLAFPAAFIEFEGAGTIGKALSFFQILNIGKNWRVDKSKIISFKNMISFLYIVVFCQHFACLHFCHDSADLHQLLKS